MQKFSIDGPFKVPLTRGIGGRVFDSECAAQFFNKHPEPVQDKGCYVFAFRSGRGYTPIYIGKATKSFKQEIFQPHKQVKLAKALGNRKRGSLVVFFVRPAKKRGPTNLSTIDAVETFLIQAGIKANKNLLNNRKRQIESWSINGVVRSSQGQPSTSAKDFRKCPNIDKL